VSTRRPAPQFRQRKARREWRGGRQRRWLPIAIVGGLAAILIVGVVVAVIVAGGDDDGGGASQAGGVDRVIEGPASRYVVQLGEVPDKWDILPPETYPLSAIGFVTNGYFAVRQEGEDRAAEWGYLDGYQSSFEPLGKQADLLDGGYYFRTEAYLFETVAGAREAFAYLEEHHRSLPASETEQAPEVGNEAGAYKIIRGTVGTSDVPAVYYRIVFRRGNLVSVVQTQGAETMHTLDRATGIAAGIDAKALGQRESPTPTPAPSTTQLSPPPTATTGP